MPDRSPPGSAASPRLGQSDACTECRCRDALLYAVGRQGSIESLNLGAAGLEADERGRITVDSGYRTKVPGIYAAGDIIGFPSLASVCVGPGALLHTRRSADVPAEVKAWSD